MINFPQETESQADQSSFPIRTYPAGQTDVTTGIDEIKGPFSLHIESNLVTQARGIISQIENQTVAEQVEKILSTIQWMMGLVQQVGRDLSHIPPIHAYADSDGSVLLEWIFPDFRVGFNIEPNPQDSGWHIVSNKNLNDVTASGRLTNTEEITAFLIESILPNI